MTGSLAAVLWWRVARQNGAAVSMATYARYGLVIGLLPLAAAATTLALASPSA